MPPGVSAATLMFMPTANLPTFPAAGAGEAGEGPGLVPEPPPPTGGLPPGIGGLNFPELGELVPTSGLVGAGELAPGGVGAALLGGAVGRFAEVFNSVAGVEDTVGMGVGSYVGSGAGAGAGAGVGADR